MTSQLPARHDHEPVNPAAADQRLAQLTARADLIAEELDLVVKQMSELLRKKYTE